MIKIKQIKRRSKKELHEFHSYLENNFKEIRNLYLEGKTLKEIAIDVTGIKEDRKRISSFLKSKGINVSYFTYSFDKRFFNTIDTEHKAYWLGFIYADGQVNIDKKYNTGKLIITLSEVDKNHLEKFRRDISSNHPINTYPFSSGFKTDNNYSRITLTSIETVRDLIDKGSYPNKTEILTFPSKELVPNNLAQHFIRGYMDGDGSIVEPKSKKYQLTFCGTKEFLTSIQNYWGLDLKLSKRHDNDVNNYTLAISGNLQVERLLSHLYNDATVYLDRKHERFIRLKELNKSRKKFVS